MSRVVGILSKQISTFPPIHIFPHNKNTLLARSALLATFRCCGDLTFHTHSQLFNRFNSSPATLVTYFLYRLSLCIVTTHGDPPLAICFCKVLEERIPFSIRLVFAGRHRMSALVPCQNTTNAGKALQGQEILRGGDFIQTRKTTAVHVGPGWHNVRESGN